MCSLEPRLPFLYGGGSGFETGICVEFSAQIHSLARNKERGQEAVQQLQGEGLSPEFLPLDVDNEESIQAAREEVQRKYGHIDVLINNAGVLFRVRSTLNVTFKLTCCMLSSYRRNGSLLLLSICFLAPSCWVNSD